MGPSATPCKRKVLPTVTLPRHSQNCNREYQEVRKLPDDGRSGNRLERRNIPAQGPHNDEPSRCPSDAAGVHVDMNDLPHVGSLKSVYVGLRFRATAE